jgi:formylglycine-generating enzyme required for sulfatase activity/tRNA A-37 threonylcarbamoyl transferase component Bud32
MGWIAARPGGAVPDLGHAGTCGALEVAEGDGTPFLAMQHVGSQTLAAQIGSAHAAHRRLRTHRRARSRPTGAGALMDVKTDPGESLAGSSADWSRVDWMLFSWLALSEEHRERRFAAMRVDDPAMAEALSLRLDRVIRLAQVVDGPADGTQPRPDQVFGDYRIVRRLGQGGMGTVFLAEQQALRRRVALKVIRSERLSDPGARQRFQREARALSTLRNPHLCTVFDFGEVDDAPFLTMQYVEGETLAERLAAQRAGSRDGTSTAPDTRARIGELLLAIEQVARALHAAHAAGVVHRDVKPGNIMIDRSGNPVLLDFGLARVDDAAGGPTLTRTGDRVGTPAYMSPEQLLPEGRAIDRRSDVYSLGVTLFEALTLRLPFAAPTSADLYEQILREPTPDPRRHNPRLPPDVGVVLAKAMEKEPARRYATAGEFADDLARLRRGLPVQAARVGGVARTWRWTLRHPAAAALMVTLGGIALNSWFLWRSRQRQSSIEQTAARLTQRTQEFDLVAWSAKTDMALAAESPLYPAWPAQAPALADWLEQHGKPPCAALPLLRDAVAGLRHRALPYGEAEQRSDQRKHPDYPKLFHARAELAACRRLQALHLGKAGIEPVVLPENVASAAAYQLDVFAFFRVAPFQKRMNFGEESIGLAAARLGLERVAPADKQCAESLRRTLAWAQVANGLDADALATVDALAAELAPGADRAPLDEIRRHIADHAGDRLTQRITELSRLVDELTAATATRSTWRFADQAEQFLHDTLSRQILRVLEFERSTVAAVEERLAWARSVQRLCIDDHSRRWAAARMAIAEARPYREAPVDLRPQLDLVPIGCNPATGLWEFYHLPSATPPATAADAVAIPAHRADGSLPVTEASGLVFVLVPGGTFVMGETPDPDVADSPERAADERPPHQVRLAPFLLSRYEMTQAQWKRLSRGAEPSQSKAGTARGGKTVTAMHPVESVTWEECTGLLGKHGLLLPTEARWEYSARAGTQTPWWTGDRSSSLASGAPAENLADRSFQRQMSVRIQAEPWDDGYSAAAPVGSFRANPWGLHDVLGNVSEWCQDWSADYHFPNRAGDGLHLVARHSAVVTRRCVRGGWFQAVAANSRASVRSGQLPTYRVFLLGVRPARDLQ